MVAAYLNARRLLWAHVPNGGHRNYVAAAKLKAQGVKPGVPDILIFKATGVVCGVAIELKRRNAPPSAVSLEQHQWLADLVAAGWATHIAFGADEAIDFIEFAYGRK